MSFEIQYSKNSKFVVKSLSNLEEKEQEAFKLLMALKAKEMKTPEVTYKIK
jgi:hypothetical protein